MARSNNVHNVPAPTAEEILVEMEARRPIIRWGMEQWLRSSLGIDRPGVWCPTLKSWGFHPWQWTPNQHPHLTTPTLGAALKALRPQLTLEVRKGLRTSPLRVCRLTYRAALVYLLAALSRLPGPQRGMIQRAWPRCLEHLAATLEINHEKATGRIREAGYGQLGGRLRDASRAALSAAPLAFDARDYVDPSERDRSRARGAARRQQRPVRSAMPIGERLVAVWRKVALSGWQRFSGCEDDEIDRLRRAWMA